MSERLLEVLVSGNLVAVHFVAHLLVSPVNGDILVVVCRVVVSFNRRVDAVNVAMVEPDIGSR